MHALNAGGAHLSDVAVLELKGTKSGVDFNITFPGVLLMKFSL